MVILRWDALLLLLRRFALNICQPSNPFFFQPVAAYEFLWCCKLPAVPDPVLNNLSINERLANPHTPITYLRTKSGRPAAGARFTGGGSVLGEDITGAVKMEEGRGLVWVWELKERIVLRAVDD